MDWWLVILRCADLLRYVASLGGERDAVLDDLILELTEHLEELEAADGNDN